MLRLQRAFFPGMAFLLMCVLLCGCASTVSTPVSAATAKQRVFLSHYDQLKPMESGDDEAQSWRLSGVDWKKYDKVFIERIQVFPQEDSKYKGIDPTDFRPRKQHAKSVIFFGHLLLALRRPQRLSIFRLECVLRDLSICDKAALVHICALVVAAAQVVP